MNAELAARTTAAAAVLADFGAAMADRGSWPFDWQTWALRLAEHTRFLVQQLQGEQPPSTTLGQTASFVARDGSAWLNSADL